MFTNVDKTVNCTAPQKSSTSTFTSTTWTLLRRPPCTTKARKPSTSAARCSGPSMTSTMTSQGQSVSRLWKKGKISMYLSWKALSFMPFLRALGGGGGGLKQGMVIIKILRLFLYSGLSIKLRNPEIGMYLAQELYSR